MHELKSEAPWSHTLWKVIGSQPPPCAEAAVTKASRSESVIGLAPSTAMVRTASGSLGGRVSIQGGPGVVLEFEMPPPARDTVKPHCWTRLSTVELEAPNG